MFVVSVFLLSAFAPCTADSHLRNQVILATENMTAATEEGECACVKNGLEVEKDAPKQHFEGPYIKRTADDGKKTYLPADYGEECKAWEDKTDPACDSEYPPGYCSAKWCYVSSDCKVKDKKKTLYFKGEELYYSYGNCGSFDAYTAMHCLKQEKEKCEEPCAWNFPSGVCQNQLCQCSGENFFDKAKKEKHGETYGETCHAWDKESCKDWEDKSELGLWCCKQWCYVDKSCPSAKASSVGENLFYSYYSCPDKVSELKSCPWKKANDYEGDPLPVSPEASKELNKQSKAKPAQSMAPATAAPAVAASIAVFTAMVL